MANRFWPNQDPLGKQVKFVEDGSVGTVVGVVGDAKHYWIDEDQRPQVYISYSQNPGYFGTAVIRTSVEPLSLSEQVRQAIWKVDPDRPCGDPPDGLSGEEVLTKRFYGDGNLRHCVLLRWSVYGVISYPESQSRNWNTLRRRAS